MLKNKVLVFLFAILAVGCFSGGRQEPSWVGKTWIEGQKYFFSGISGECRTLKEAKDQSFLDGAVKAAQYIGMSISIRSETQNTQDKSLLDEQIRSQVSETFLSQAIVKEFVYTKTADGFFVGHSLIEYDNRVLQAEKRRRLDLEAERAKKLAERKKVGALSIRFSPTLNRISADIKEYFQAQGYLLGDKGIPVEIYLVEERFSKSLQNIHSCNLKIAVDFDGDVKVFEATGFGADKGRAQADAFKTWLALFKKENGI